MGQGGMTLLGYTSQMMEISENNDRAMNVSKM